jgi:O-glycosyl hydrolase
MGKKKNFLFVLLGITLIFALGFTTCDMEGEKETIVNAADPVITDDPTGRSLELGGHFELFVTADSPDGGVLSYQWYMLPGEYDNPVGEQISGETISSFYHEGLDNEGIYYYYVAVTNTKSSVNGKKTATVNSKPATIAVFAPGSPLFPVITGQPADKRSPAGDIELTVEAELPEENPDGVLSYQWFGASTYSNKDGARIDRATEAEYTFPADAPGTYWFYVVVTNTVGEGEDAQAKSISSHPATITIVADLTPNATIQIFPTRKSQYVRGFGGMDIPWANFWNIELSEYEKMFNPDTGLGYNILRVMIMPGIPSAEIDNEVDNATVQETIDYYLNGDGNRPNYYEGVKIVNGYGGYVLASPWSPPPKWKSNNSKNGGGHLIETYYHDYALYLKEFAQIMYDNGAPIYAISIQNEPNYVATYDGCEWTGEQMRNFFVQEGHFTDGVKGWGGGKEIPVVLTMNGESANHPRINDPAMDNVTSRAVIDLLGRHTYGDVMVRYAKALDFSPKKEVWMSEHNMNSGNPTAYPNDSTWNYVWQFLNDVDVSIRLNDESAFIWWALKRFYSFVGEGQYTTTEGTILPRGYALSHYAKYAKEKWRCAVMVQGTLADKTTAITDRNVNNTGFDRNSTVAKVTGFVSDDGNEFSLVMYTPTNTSGARGVDLGTVEIQMPNDFIPTKVTAMRSTASTKAKSEDVLLSADKKKAYIMLPPGNIVSVKFTK